jgi:hypothetical protein
MASASIADAVLAPMGRPDRGYGEAEQGKRQRVPGALLKSRNGEDVGARD